MKRTFLSPVAVLSGIVGCMVLMARSDFFTPIVRFVHTGNITPLQSVLCLFFTVAGFAACYYLLNILCSYFVPRMGTSSGDILQPKEQGGKQKP